MGKIQDANINQRNGVAILISDKVGWKGKKIIKNRQGHYIMIKDMAIINVYSLKNSFKTHEAQTSRTKRRQANPWS